MNGYARIRVGDLAIMDEAVEHIIRSGNIELAYALGAIRMRLCAESGVTTLQSESFSVKVPPRGRDHPRVVS